jgi:integrase/recombinase XerD
MAQRLAKDRNVIISPALLSALRLYWQAIRPTRWLFAGREYSIPLGVKSAQRAFTEAKRRAGIDKIGGIHALRHAYATHQLESGMPVHQMQRLLGHQNIQSTLRYVHWVPDYRESRNGVDLIEGLAIKEVPDD